MPVAHHNGLNIFFAHVPKTGGSSVEDYLIRRFGPLSLIDVNKRTGVKGTGLIVPATHLAAVDIKELVPTNLAYSFAVVRHPVDRLMSEFRYQNKVSRMSRLGFPIWLRIMLHAARMEPRLYENHIRPQNELVPEDAEIYRLEDGFERLEAKLDEIVGEVADGVSVGHLNKRKKEPLSITRDDAALISAYYGPDFLAFGYDKPEEDGLESDRWVILKDIVARPLAWLLVRKQRLDWVK